MTPADAPLTQEELAYLEGARSKQVEVMTECERYDLGRTDQEIVIGKLIGFVDRLLATIADRDRRTAKVTGEERDVAASFVMTVENWWTADRKVPTPRCYYGTQAINDIAHIIAQRDAAVRKAQRDAQAGQEVTREELAKTLHAMSTREHWIKLSEIGRPEDTPSFWLGVADSFRAQFTITRKQT